MKTLLLTLLFCIFNLTTTEIIGKYQIESKRSIDTLELKEDGTYEYQSRGDSCWTWSDINGTWKLKGDILILHHEYSYVESASEYIEKIDEVSKEIVRIDIKDNFGKPKVDFVVNYSSVDRKTQTKKTDKNGIVVFDKYDIVYNEKDRAGIKIKYAENGNESSENRSVDRLSDRISIRINNQPETVEKNEEYRFSVDNGVIKSIEFRYVDEVSTYKKL
jgi:hypothetical protein